MRIDPKMQDLILLVLLILIIVGLPFGIRAYDRHLEPKEIRPGAKKFTLTGHAKRAGYWERSKRTILYPCGKKMGLLKNL